MGNKPKTTQPQTENVVQGRDLFQTPNYAVDLLVPFIPQSDEIWECAAGELKITNRLKYHSFKVLSTDIRWEKDGDIIDGITPQNFLTENRTDVFKRLTTIVTNPPFSLKYKFIYKAIEYNLPFAFLIPFDMCGQMAELFDKYGCQGLVPTRRIDYITPTGKSGLTGHSSYYHSFWITRYFDLPKQLTFVELTKKMKENI